MIKVFISLSSLFSCIQSNRQFHTKTPSAMQKVINLSFKKITKIPLSMLTLLTWARTSCVLSAQPQGRRRNYPFLEQCAQWRLKACGYTPLMARDFGKTQSQEAARCHLWCHGCVWREGTHTVQLHCRFWLHKAFVTTHTRRWNRKWHLKVTDIIKEKYAEKAAVLPLLSHPASASHKPFSLFYFRNTIMLC